MFILVPERVSCNRSFDLPDSAPRLRHHWSGSDTWNLEQSIDIISALLDLLELPFKPNPVSFRGGKLSIEVLQLVFHQAAARSAAACTGSLLRTRRSRAAPKLQSVGIFRFVISYGRFTLLKVRLQPFFFLKQIAQSFLTERSAPLDWIADVLAPDRFGKALSHQRIGMSYIQIDQARTTADRWSYHAGHRTS